MAQSVNTTTTPSPSSGLVMDEPYETIFAISNYIQDFIWVIIILLETLTVIFFVTEFTKKTSYFRTSYYIMLAIGLAVDAVCTIFTLRKYVYADTNSLGDVYLYLENASSYFLAIYSDVWNITLILNRCTAIWFTFYSSRIWGVTGTIIAIIINIISPLAITGFVLFQPSCVIYRPAVPSPPECSPLASASYITIGSFTVISATTMSIFVIYCSKTRVQAFSEKSAAIEKRLIFQSILCLILLSFYHLLRSAYMFTWENDLLDNRILALMEDVAMIFYIIQHFLEIFVLFIVSPTFRTAILKFYTFGKYKPNSMGKTITQVTILNRLNK